MSVARVVSVVFAGLLAAGGLGASPAAAVSADPPVVVYDGDMDVDDISTLALLCEQDKEHRIELRAVTVDNNGFGTPGRSLQHVHSVLNQCGRPDIPVADGSDTVVHAAPADARQTVETVLTGALNDGSAHAKPGPLTAAQLITWAIATSPRPVTLLTTGPLSNVATALTDDGWLATRIAALYQMGGAIAVPGNLFGSALPGYDNTQEMNMWLDPAAARTVFHALAPDVTHLVPLDATNSVPITPQYIAELGADQRTPSTALVYRIMTQPDMTSGIQAGLYYWWDALTAIAAFDNSSGIVAFHQLNVDMVLDGQESGRTIVTADGVPQQVAYAADQSAFEQAFDNALNGY